MLNSSLSPLHPLKPRAVIFDLDVTLLDTAPDIIAACNATLEHFGYAPISEELARSRVTSGMRLMLKLGVPEADVASGKADIEGTMRDYFAQYYTSHICVHTKPFAGMLELLHELKQHEVHLAVVTNKYEHMTHELLQHFAFYQDLEVILGCDSIQNSKPHPEPILKTLEHLKVAPYEALYVGDHLNDIVAANCAKVYSAAALWGYGARECGDPRSWHAKFLLPSVADLCYLCLGE